MDWEMANEEAWNDAGAVVGASLTSPSSYDDASHWITVMDDASGNKYYQNTITGQSQWDSPFGDESYFSSDFDQSGDYDGTYGGAYQQEGGELAAVQEEYWEEEFDENGTAYYVNQATGEARWELPTPALAQELAVDEYGYQQEQQLQPFTSDDGALEEKGGESTLVGSVGTEEPTVLEEQFWDSWASEGQSRLQEAIAEAITKYQGWTDDARNDVVNEFALSPQQAEQAHEFFAARPPTPAASPAPRAPKLPTPEEMRAVKTGAFWESWSAEEQKMLELGVESAIQKCEGWNYEAKKEVYAALANGINTIPSITDKNRWTARRITDLEHKEHRGILDPEELAALGSLMIFRQQAEEAYTFFSAIWEAIRKRKLLGECKAITTMLAQQVAADSMVTGIDNRVEQLRAEWFENSIKTREANSRIKAELKVNKDDNTTSFGQDKTPAVGTEAYAKFIADLEAQGINVLDIREAANAKAAHELKQHTEAQDALKGKTEPGAEEGVEAVPPEGGEPVEGAEGAQLEDSVSAVTESVAGDPAVLEAQLLAALEAAENRPEGRKGAQIDETTAATDKLDLVSRRLALAIVRLKELEDTDQPPLRKVDLNNELIGDEGAEALADALRTSAVRQLFLLNNNITDTGAIYMAEAMKNNKRSLVELYLNGNAVGDEGVQSICETFSNSPLKVLNLSSNPVSHRGAQYIAQMLVKPGCEVQSLFLSGVMDPKAAFIGGSRASASLEKGSADWREPAPVVARIGAEGTACIAAALLSPHGSKVQKLWLVNCAMKGTGCKALAAAIFCNTSLTELNITGNDLEGEQHQVLRALEVNANMKNLICRNCGLSPKDNQALQRRLNAAPPELGWTSKKVTAASAGPLRHWLLDLVKARGFVFPKAPGGGKRIKNKRKMQPPGSEEVLEPMWKRGSLVDTWSMEDLELLMSEPLPEDQSYDVLKTLHDEVRASLDSHEHMEHILVRDRDKLDAELALVERDLKAERKQNLALTKRLASSLEKIKKRADMSKYLYKQAEKKMKIVMQNKARAEESIGACHFLVNDVRETAAARHPEMAMLDPKLGVHALPDADVVRRLQKIDPDMSTQLMSAVKRRDVCETALEDCEKAVKAQIVEETKAAKHHLTDQAEQKSAFEAAREETEDANLRMGRLKRQFQELKEDHERLQTDIAPIADLTSRLKVWLQSLEHLAHRAREDFDWDNSVKDSCGNAEIDDNLRREIRHKRDLEARLEQAESLVADLERQQLAHGRQMDHNFEGGLKAERRRLQLEDQVTMAQEDADGVEALIAVTTAELARRKVEHAVVKLHPFPDENYRPKGGRTRESDLVHVRALKPVKQLQGAFQLNWAMDEHVKQIERAKKEAERKRILEEQAAQRKKEDEDPFLQVEMTAKERNLYLDKQIQKAAKAGGGPEGDGARKKVRELTRMSTMVKQETRNIEIAVRSMKWSVRQKVTKLSTGDLVKQLPKYGLDPTDFMDEDEMIEALVEARYAAECPAPLDVRTYTFPKIKIVKEHPKDEDSLAGDLGPEDGMVDDDDEDGGSLGGLPLPPI